MKNVVLALTACTALGASAADFNVDFHRKYREMQAETLLDGKQYVEARQAFEQLAATAGDSVATAMWKARAAIAMGLQEGQSEAGLAAARAVDDRPYAIQAQIELLRGKEDYKGLIEAFGGEEIAAWPERTLPRTPRYPEADTRCLALHDRGYAYYKLGNGAAAAADLEGAERFARSDRRRLNIWRDQAAVLSQLLKNEAKAFEANLKIAGLSGGADYFRGVIGAAEYLRKQGRFDEALAILDRMEPYGKTGYWLSAGLSAVGRTLADAGRTDAAVAAYAKIAGSAGVSDSERNAARLAMGETLAAAGRTRDAVAAYEAVTGDAKAPAAHKEKAQAALNGLVSPAN